MSPHPYLADLLEKTSTFVRRFAVIGEHELTAVALWNAHTFVYDCGRATPYLHPNSPEPGSGKTTLLDVLELTACNAVQADGLSEAALYRMIAKVRPSLLFDEIDAVFGKHDSDTEGIRQVLNSGYRQHKKVWRCVPPSHDVEPFDVYCPKALAGLNNLPGTLAHRAIPIEMKPPLPTDVYEELDPEEVEEEAEVLRQNLQSWADESEDVLRDPRLKPARLDGLDARGNEIWRILFRIADHAGGEWPATARAAALALSGRGRQQHDASAGIRLLAHIRDLFPDEKISCAAIVEALNADDQLPYGGWSDGKGITTRELGKKLQPYGIRAKPIRIDGKRAGNGYEHDQFEDAWSRYLAVSDTSNRYTGTSLYPSQKSAEANRYSDPLVPVSEEGANPHGQRDVPVVPVSSAGIGVDDPDADIDFGSVEPRNGTPLPGDEGFDDFLLAAVQAGHITQGEALERYELHKLIKVALAA
jgi:Protein of unknown function (DUF3631)